MTIVRFEREGLVASPWKNGGGETREIVRVPAGSSMDVRLAREYRRDFE